MKYGFPLVCGMIGSACAAVISVGTGVEAFSIGVGGLPGILSIKPEYWISFAIAMAVAIAVPFLLTMLIGSRKLTQEDRGMAEQSEIPSTAAASSSDPASGSLIPPAADEEKGSAKAGELLSPLSGRILSLSEIPDEVFSQGILGEGVGIDPSSNVVLAPADATVSTVMEDSRHACGLQLENGMGLLIHVGSDTVSMAGDGFELHVKEGDTVRRGDRLITFDPAKIRAAGHSTITAFLVSEPGDARLEFITGIEAEAGKTPVIRYE